MNELREQLAALVHDIWIGWAQGMISKGCRVDSHTGLDGILLIERPVVNRWMCQIFTEYIDLDDEEKDIDRMIADKILAVIEKSGKKFCECGEKEQG